MWQDDDQDRKLLLLGAMTIIINEESQKRSRRRIWVKPWVARRKRQGVHHNLFLELKFEDPNKYRRCLRMDAATFEDLVVRVTPHLLKQHTHLREPISPAERLSVYLRHIATGETQESLSLCFRMGQSTISGIIRDTSAAILEVLRGEYLKFPASEEEWKVVAYEFGERWNFFNCLGAMDGKHVRIDPPLNSGSMYYNYKDTFSIVLLAVVDAQLRFIYVDVGTNGRVSDSGVWNKSTLKAALEENRINVPGRAQLPGTEGQFPFVIVGDEGFPLTQKVLIPYPGPQCANRRDRRIFNYRLSRARRCSENAFGVMGARFQIFRAPMRYDPDVATNITLSCCCLHNMLRSQVVGRLMYAPPDFIDVEDENLGTIHQGQWRYEPINGMENLHHQGGNRHANPALFLRDRWCAYFNGPGAVPWQDGMVP